MPYDLHSFPPANAITVAAHSWLAGLAKLLIRLRLFVLLFWVAAAGGTAYAAMHLISATSTAFTPPPHSQTMDSIHALMPFFPYRVHSTSVALYIRCPSNCTMSSALRAFAYDMANWTREYPSSHGFDDSFVVDFESYFTLADMPGMLPVAKELLRADDKVALISATITPWSANAPALDFGDAWNAASKQFAEDRDLSDYFIGPTGMATQIRAALAACVSELTIMEAVVLPIAGLLFIYVVRCFRLLILPILCLGASASISFGIMYPIALVSEVFGSTPSLMMSVLTAMSIDYALFLATRFREELGVHLAHHGGSRPGDVAADEVRAIVEKSAIVMTCTAGHTIIVSGVTLGVCFLGLTLFPVQVMSSVGVGCAICIFFTLVINLSLTPAIICLFPNFFFQCVPTGSSFLERLSNCVCCSDGAEYHLESFTLSESGIPDSHAGRTAHSDLERHPLLRTSDVIKPDDDGEESRTQVHTTGSRWRSVMRFITRFPTNFIVSAVIMALVTPLAWEWDHMNVSDALALDIPRKTPAMTAYHNMIRDYGYGITLPMYIGVRLPNITGETLLTSATLWNTSVDAVTRLRTAKYPKKTATPSSFISPFVIDLPGQASRNITLEEIQLCQQYGLPECQPLLYLMNNSIASSLTGSEMEYEGLAALIMVEVLSDFDPLGSGGQAFLLALRNAMTAVEEAHDGWKLDVVGISAASMDAVKAVNDVFPIMAALTAGSVLIFVGFSTGSLLVPLRGIISIAVTLAFVYGLCKLIFQDGILNWTTSAALSQQPSFGEPGVMWMPPIICFPVIAGVALDYDVFLVMRMIEFSRAGYPAVNAIIEGVVNTGGVITAAGVTMTIAFSGLLLSTTDMLNQLSVFLILAVLFDTFIVRSLFVPALMSLLGEANWFPGNCIRKRRSKGYQPVEGPRVIS